MDQCTDFEWSHGVVIVAYGYDGPRQTSQAHNPQASGPVQVLVWDSTVKGGDREVQDTPCRNNRKRPVGSRDSEGEEVGEAVEELAAGKKAKKTAPKAKAETKEKGKGKKAQETKPRAGKGSRSGPANRRAGGASDDEVQKLSGAIKRDAEPRLSKAQLKKLQLVMEEDSEAEDDADGQGEGDSEEVGSDVDAGEFDESRWGLGPEEKVMAVEYLADPARYASIRTKLGEYCITVRTDMWSALTTHSLTHGHPTGRWLRFCSRDVESPRNRSATSGATTRSRSTKKYVRSSRTQAAEIPMPHAWTATRAHLICVLRRRVT